MFDIGVNLLHQQFDEDREQVVARAAAAGVHQMLITSTDLPLSERSIAYCQQQAALHRHKTSLGQKTSLRHNTFCTVGVHPHDAKTAPCDLAERLISLAGHPLVKAIGETGLDFNRDFSPRDIQRRVFVEQLEVAVTTGLPVFVHDRDSDGGVFDILRERMTELSGAVIHCFTGTASDLERYLALDCYIGITGWVCDRRRGKTLRSLVKSIPLSRLMIETDAPFLLPHTIPSDWHQTQAAGSNRRRNEPALLGLVADQIAVLKEIDPRIVIAATSANARRLFRCPEPAPDGSLIEGPVQL